MASQSLLAVPAKSTKPVDFQDKLLRFIEQNYDEKPSSFLDAIKELNVLRDSSVVKTPDRHETGLDLIVRYYDQLCAIENKLPISESQTRIKFTWSDAFQTGILGGSKSASQVSGQFERCCVLFNIASLQSQIAKFQNFDSDEGLKNAAKHFQSAAGSFQLLREQVFAHLQTAPTADLSAECTTALSTLMLAQAQESFVIKACKGKIKCQVIAKLAMQCADLYAEALSNMQVGSVRGFWDKGWLPTVAAKSSYFHAVAQHQLGLASQAQKSFGEAVARMKRGVELVTEAEKRGEGYFKPYDVTATLKRDFDTVNKDNNFIYNDRIPDIGTLEPPGKAAVAKVVQFQSPSANFVDLFAHLVPLPVSQALQNYNAKKDSLVQGELEKIRQATSALNELLSDKNLPAAIEDVSGNQVPESIKEKSEQIRAQGGMDAIQRKIYELPELLDRNREIIRETGRMLDEEEREDTAMKDRFTAKWKRTSSSKLTESLRGEVAKFQQIIDNATKADMTVRQKFDTHQSAITTLTKEEPDLEASLPKVGAQAALLSGSSAVQELKQLMEDVGTLKAEREVIEKELKDPITDIAPKFLQALKEIGDVDEEAISEAHLRGEFGKLQQQVAESIQRQDELVARIESAHGKFQAETQQHGTSARDTVLKELAAGFDTYQELMGNLQEGTQFYNNLTQLLVKLQGKVSDFVFARNTEKDDLLKELQKDIASSPAQPLPTTPQYQQPKPQATQPPARPPPPKQQQQQQPAPPAPAPATQSYQPPPAPATQSYQPPPAQGVPPQGYAAPYGYGAPPQPYYQHPPPPGGYAPPPSNPYAPPPGYAPPLGYGPPPHGYAPPPQPYGYYPPQPPGAYGQPYQPPPRR